MITWSKIIETCVRWSSCSRFNWRQRGNIWIGINICCWSNCCLRSNLASKFKIQVQFTYCIWFQIRPVLSSARYVPDSLFIWAENTKFLTAFIVGFACSEKSTFHCSKVSTLPRRPLLKEVANSWNSSCTIAVARSFKTKPHWRFRIKIRNYIDQPISYCIDFCLALGCKHVNFFPPKIAIFLDAYFVVQFILKIYNARSYFHRQKLICLSTFLELIPCLIEKFWGFAEITLKFKVSFTDHCLVLVKGRQLSMMTSSKPT